MAMSLKRVSLFLLCSLSAFFNVSVSAVTMMELKQADKVRIRTWIEPRENIIARQQVNLQIEIATDKWFSGGTKIGGIEVRDAIVLQREMFAMNSSRQEGDRNWTVQQWTLFVYPQRGGKFEIPQIPLRLSIAGEDLETIVGELNTRPLSFVAALPEPILENQLDKTGWIATTRFDVKESFDKPFDDLKPGDAITRQISMSADDLPAMMLPIIAEDGIQGMAVYRKPPRLTDKSNRGIFIAERIQVLTYLFENPGEYQLPQQTFYWWNLESQSLESIDLDAKTLEVRSLFDVGDGGIEQQPSTNQLSLVESIPVLNKVVFTFLLVIVIIVVFRRLRKKPIHVKLTEPRQLSEKDLRKQFESACRDSDPEHAMGLFYKWLDNFAGSAFKGSIQKTLNDFDQGQLTLAFKNITQTIYSADKSNQIDLKSFARTFISELKRSGGPRIFNSIKVELKLN
jgi:hypothetical protein